MEYKNVLYKTIKDSIKDIRKTAHYRAALILGRSSNHGEPFSSQVCTPLDTIVVGSPAAGSDTFQIYGSIKTCRFHDRRLLLGW
jgi:hypothetical protein